MFCRTLLFVFLFCMFSVLCIVCFCVVLCIDSPFVLSLYYFCTRLPTTAFRWKYNCSTQISYNIVSYYSYHIISYPITFPLSRQVSSTLVIRDKHILMTEAANSSETTNSFNQTTRHMPEDSSLQNHRYLYLTSQILQYKLVSTHHTIESCRFRNSKAYL
jgi:hypothetical protein